MEPSPSLAWATGTMRAAVAAYLSAVAEIADGLYAAGLLAARLMSAGGSAFFDRVLARFPRPDWRVVLRSGCYLTHDSKMYRDFFEQMRDREPEIKDLGVGLQAALETARWVSTQLDLAELDLLAHELGGLARRPLHELGDGLVAQGAPAGLVLHVRHARWLPATCCG